MKLNIRNFKPKIESELIFSSILPRITLPYSFIQNQNRKMNVLNKERPIFATFHLPIYLDRNAYYIYITLSYLKFIKCMIQLS